MRVIGSFSKDIYDSIKNYCSNNDLTFMIKSILSLEEGEVLDRLNNNYSDVSIEEFDNLIVKYFDRIKFCDGNYDLEELQSIKDDIGNIFLYVDSLNLDSSYSSKLFDNFFGLLERYDINESRGIYDLITIDSVKNSKIMKNYLDNNDFSSNNIISFVKNLYNLFDDLDGFDKKKVDYIFHSSYESLLYFMNNPNDISIYLNKNIISNFNKESLSLLFRIVNYDKNRIFFEASDKFLKVISRMNEYVLSVTGHNADFLDSVFRVLKEGGSTVFKEFISLFEEYYDRFYNKGLARGFENDELFNELVSVVLDSGFTYFIEHNNIFSLDDLLSVRREELENMYIKVFGKDHLLDLKYKTLDLDNDLIVYSSYAGLNNLVDAFLWRVYGINHEDAININEKYGKFLDVCCDNFDEEDKATLEMLKTICNVCNLGLEDKDKIKTLQIAFYNYINENGMFRNNKNASFIMARSLINRMYMKVFNKVLYEPSFDNVLYHEEKIPVIDASVNFNMIVSAVNGTSEFFDLGDAKKRYNTTSNSMSQGICTSFINNENLGVISLDAPLLAYNNLDIGTLNLMGVGDVYSDVEVLSIGNNNESLGDGNYFFTPKEFADYTRFGYNEMVFDRFLFKDDDDIIKVQPKYIVVYKVDDNYKKTNMYKRGVKMASDFDIPLVLVDVEKIKANEKREINLMEDELFSSSKVNFELMKKIITRYMNNYSGSLTLCRSKDSNWNYKEDFSVNGLKEFMNKIEVMTKSFSDEEVLEWVDTLKECYKLEKLKNKCALEITSYGYSLRDNEFLLDDEIHFMDKVNKIKEEAIGKYYLRNNMLYLNNLAYLPYDVEFPVKEVLINLSNYLFDHTYVKIKDNSGERVYLTKEVMDLDESKKIDYGMVISYLFGDYSNNYFANLDSDDLMYIHNTRGFGLKNGFYKDNVRKTPFLMDLVDKISDMDNSTFLRMFKPVIQDTSKVSRYSLDAIKRNLLARKNDMFYHFSKLPNESFDKKNKLNKGK